MRKLISQIKSHADLHDIVGAIAGMFIILLLVTPLLDLVNRAYEKWSPASDWFLYSSIIPAQEEFKVGEIPAFISQAEFKKNLSIQWFDTLWCDIGSRHERLTTQIDPERPTAKFPSFIGLPDENGDVPIWEYKADKVPLKATACRLESYVVATTPLGYHKEQLLLGSWFPVNK